MAIEVDALICGGGVTGLWLRALLKEYGRSVVLIEADALGAGQTIASQGILHNGAKYAAQRVHAAEAISVLPVMAFAWERHLTGDNIPDLRGTRIVTNESWCWNPAGLLPPCLGEWWSEYHKADAGVALPPPPLASVRGEVRRNNERAISPASLLHVLAGDDRRDLLRLTADRLRWTLSGPGAVDAVTLSLPEGGPHFEVRPRHVFLTAGAGNAALRESVGLPGEAGMQRRPLRMGLVRGDLPAFCGHWFDERGPRLTISTQFDSRGRTVWQLGGRLGEVALDEPVDRFLARAQREVTAGAPDVDLTRTQWSSYDAVRAEAKSPDGRMPALPEVLREGNVITMWPTKLALVPYLMIDVRRALDAGGALTQESRERSMDELPDGPRPDVATPPWDLERRWVPDSDVAKAI